MQIKKFNSRLLTDSALELIAARFKALSEVNRLKIILALKSGEKNVSALTEETGLTQTNLSRHLQTLTEVGLLSRRREGVAIFYAIQDPTIFVICEEVCSGLSKRLSDQAVAFNRA